MQSTLEMLAVTMVPRRSEMNRELSSEGHKKNRGESELKKCLGSDTDELLLKSYSCAWQKEILVQGRLYITAHHFCFFSSILGFETKMTIGVKDVTSMKKEKTALLFPNAIVISTADKRYGFSTFANRNKSYDILQMVWQNENSDPPVSQELLAARIKLLKVKTKSVESSPVSSPSHPPRHPVWQLSLQRSSKSSGQTDSDSSGTSPILLARAVTPPLPPTLTLVGVAPRVVVTPSETSLKTNTLNTHCHPESDSSHDSLFVDANDNSDFELSNLNSDGKTRFLNSNYDSIDTSESTHREEEEEMESSGSSSETDVTVGPPESVSYLRKRYSSPLRKSSKGKPDTQSPETKSLDLGIVFRAGGEGGEEDDRETVDPLSAGASVERAGEEQPRAVPSVLKEILERVHVHPTRVGLWRLQKALQDWCTPSNFINFLIVISILLLLISTASMTCRLSYVNPAFQPFIAWQPWCRLCNDCRSSAKPHPPVGGVTSGGYDRIGGEREGLWTLDFFEELVKQHSEPPEVFDTGEQNTNT